MLTYEQSQTIYSHKLEQHQAMVRAALPEGVDYNDGLYGIVGFDKDRTTVAKYAIVDCKEIPSGVLEAFMDNAGYLAMVPDPLALGYAPLPCPYKSFFLNNANRNLGEYVGGVRQICKYIVQDEECSQREFNDYYVSVKRALLDLLDSRECPVPTTGDLPSITFNVGVLRG